MIIFTENKENYIDFIYVVLIQSLSEPAASSSTTKMDCFGSL